MVRRNFFEKLDSETFREEKWKERDRPTISRYWQDMRWHPYCETSPHELTVNCESLTRPFCLGCLFVDPLSAGIKYNIQKIVLFSQTTKL